VVRDWFDIAAEAAIPDYDGSIGTRSLALSVARVSRYATKKLTKRHHQLTQRLDEPRLDNRCGASPRMMAISLLKSRMRPLQKKMPYASTRPRTLTG